MFSLEGIHILGMSMPKRYGDYRPSRDQILMATAAAFAMRSTCLRGNVGAVIARQGRILSTGYNGAPSGMPHCTPKTCQVFGQPCLISVHAEANCLVFAARLGMSAVGTDMYCTHSPCQNCAMLIINAGIKRLVYIQEYRDSNPLLLLEKAGVTIERSELYEVSASLIFD